jgi:hypothetical protein
MTFADVEPFRGGRRPLLGGLGAALLGALLLALGLVLAPRQTLFSYLAAYAWAHSIVLGMLALLMTCHAMGATWPVALRRLQEAVVGAMPLISLLFLPVLLGMSQLYPWRHPEAVADPVARELLEHKLGWLNWGGFTGRAVAYQVLWLATARALRRWSFEMDHPSAPDRTRAMKILSSIFLPAVGLALTFAAFDWLMSLSPDWYSTMFGLYYSIGGFLAAIALWTILTAAVQRTGRLAGVGRSHYYALGRLLLAFVVTWAYLAFFQFFLIWIANKPLEARWYVDRSRGGWAVVSGLLFFGHFAAPFVLLLSYRLKQRLAPLTVLSAWILVMHYVDVHWMVAPARGGGPIYHWLDLGALLFVAGLALAFAVWRQRGRPLVPTGDPALDRAFAYESY